MATPYSRQARESREALRGPDGRDRRRTEGQFKQYYSDAGVSTTPEAYGKWRSAENEYQKGIAQSQSEINKAKSQLGSAAAEISGAYDQLPGVKEAVASGYKSYSSKFIPVYVMNGQNIEAKYSLPKSVASNIASSQGLRTAWYNDGNQLNVDVKVDGGRIRGEELHQAMSDAERDVKTAYYSEAIPKIASELGYAKEQLSGYESQLSGAQANVDAQQAKLNAAKQKHDAELKAMRDEYQNKLNTMKNFFGGLSVEKGTSKGNSGK